MSPGHYLKLKGWFFFFFLINFSPNLFKYVVGDHPGSQYRHHGLCSTLSCFDFSVT